MPTQIAYDLALKYGLPSEKVKVTGLPINPAFARETRSRAELRAELGWRDDLITVLAVGSTRVRNLPETLNVLNHSGLPLQFVIACGGDDELYAHFSQVEWHHPAHVHYLVSNMPLMMRAADCTVGKAGGLYVTEALACGLPILLVDLIEGQETGNADFVVDGGAGELVQNPIAVLECLFHWLDKDGLLLAERSAKARQLGHPRAAYEAAELVWQAAHTKPRQTGLAKHRRSVTELLNEFNIPWKEFWEDFRS